MTPDEHMVTDKQKQSIRRDLQQYATGTLDEWLRTANILQTDSDHNGTQVRIKWENVTDGAMIASLSEASWGVAKYGRYGVTVTVDILPDLPPIGPENDPAIAYEQDCALEHGAGHIDCPKCWSRSPRNPNGKLIRTADSHPCIECLIDPAEDPAPWCDCRPEEQHHSADAGPCRRRAHMVENCPNRPVVAHEEERERKEVEALETNTAPEWVPAALLFSLAGDRIRLGGDGGTESDVLRSSSGAWHANVVSSVMPSGKIWDKITPWEHTELRLDLSANPGFQQYPEDLPIEILMTAERRAVHVLMSAFPGSTVIDSPSVDK